MHQLSGFCRESNIATMANVATLINAFTAVQNTRLIAIGGAATRITGVLIVTCNSSDATLTATTPRYVHRISTHLNCKTLADCNTLVAALVVLMAAVIATTDFVYDLYFDFNISTNMTS
jgi:hypothetical protein